MPLSTCEWRRNRVSYTHWVDHDHRAMNCVVRWDKTWTPTLNSALHVLHGAITGATTPRARSPCAPPTRISGNGVERTALDLACSGSTPDP